MSFPIDAVITWVDGADPAHAAKMRKYGGKFTFVDDDVAGSTRYANNGEIYRCVASIRKYAPFIRTIFIVTDNQDPHIPEGNIPVVVVDHKDIFRGHEEHLPVFNSVAIETMTWRIPGLAEHYIEFNDDFMLCAPATREDFFDPDGVPVCYTKVYSMTYVWLTRMMKFHEHGHKKVTFKGLTRNGALLAGAKMHMLKLYHTPRALNRTFFEQWFEKHPEQMERNISCRFRDANQFSPEEVYYVRAWKQKKIIIRSAKKHMFYFEPKPKKDYVTRKLEELKSGNWKFCCFNSLDHASEHDRERLLDWMDKNVKMMLVLLLAVFTLTGCSNQRKFLQADERTLNRVNYNIEMADSTLQPTKEIRDALSDVKRYTRQRPNSRVLGFGPRLTMHIYCMSSPHDTNFFQNYLRRQGQAPVIYDPAAAAQTAQQIEWLLQTKGCFGSTVTYDTTHRRKYDADVTYHIRAAQRYIINDVSFHAESREVNTLLQEWQNESLLRVGDWYDQDKLAQERSRIIDKLRESGYFLASTDLVSYAVDSAFEDHKLSIRLQLRNPVVTNSDGSSQAVALRKFHVDNIYIYPNSSAATSGQGATFDTTICTTKFRNWHTDYKFLTNQPMTLKPKVIARSLFIFEGQTYRANNVERTYNSLLSLRNFKYINIEYTQSPNSNDSVPLLDAKVRLLNAKKQRLSASVELNNSSPFGSNSEGLSGGDFGIETKVNYQNKNLFGGAEIFSAEWSLLMELPKFIFKDNDQNDGSLRNNVSSFEHGIDLSLDLPTFLFPFTGDIMWQRMRPHTIFTLGANYQYRSYFERLLVNTGFGYSWFSNQRSHQLLPLELTYVRFFNIDDDFLARLGNLSDARLKYQYSNHFIMDARYDYVYNTQLYNTRKDFNYVHLSVESAGNLLGLVSAATDATKDSTGTYQVFGVPYSQYVRFNAEYKHYFYVGKKSTFVTRVMAGFGLPYLNSSVMPYEKSFYGGGPTTIRAWHLRYLGPGTYQSDESNMLERVGDMQLVLNLEHRFPMFSIFEGALFADMGNVWLYHDSEEFPGGQFRLKDFPSNIACGIGVGLRANISILTLRLDSAIPLYNPGEAAGARWRPQHWKLRQVTLNFGIDYPF
ncbi:MAG: Stealth CR1 domain-containing protein [Bacteroidales bacterium]|nr:Stealth CR1 domain-containing protein [Bacteroidales bacterium]